MVNEKIKMLVMKIKEKQELHGIADSVVKMELENFLTKHRLNPDSIKDSDIRLIIKSIRAQLRILTGQYQKSCKAQKRLSKNPDFKELLKTHISTAERISFYPTLKKLFSELHISSIIDFGCGLNPLALASQNINYHACDINETDLFIVNEFFKRTGVKGSVFTCDIRHLPENLPVVDICLIFKVLDLIEKRTHKYTEHLLRTVSTDYFLISFPTKKLSGKRMNFPRRGWIEQMFLRLGFTFKKFSSDNEIFYLATRHLIK